MKLAIRLAAVAWTVAAVLLCLSYSPQAQDGGGGEPAQLSKTYNVRALVRSELEQTPRTGAIGDVLAPDRLFPGEVEEDEEGGWSLRDSGDEARCWDDPGELGDSLSFLAGDIDYVLDGTRLTVRADEAAQKRVQWALDAINNVAKARVSMVVYRLKDDLDVGAPTVNAKDVAGWTKGARYVGTFHGGLGEPFVLQQTQHRSYVADYDVSVSQDATIASPRTGDLHTGEEFVLGAVSLSNGRLWLQGWHATMKLNNMRDVNTTCGRIEMPDVAYSYSPVSAVIENGGGTVIDAGDKGRFLVRASCDRQVANQELKRKDGSVLRLVNCVGCLRGTNLGGFWLMSPNSTALLDDAAIPQLILEDHADGPYSDATDWFLENSDFDYVSVNRVGPYLGVIVPPNAEIDQDERARLDAELHRIDAIPAEPRTIGVRISTFEVKDDAALPAGILNGRPGAADVAALKALAGGKAGFDRVSANLLRQQSDQFNVQLTTHLRGYDSVSATGASALDPRVGTLVTGEQMRWVSREAEGGKVRVELRSGITSGSGKFDTIAVGKTSGVYVERSRSALAQARLADDLAVGEYMAGISPAVSPDGRLVVIVVQRLR